MIVRRRGGGLALLRQVDHAAHCGAMAELLRDVPEPVGAFVVATTMHDNGWQEADEAPMLDPDTSLPRSYRRVPGAPYRAIWRRGIDRALAHDPYVGLLVGLHGARFFARSQDPEDRAFHDVERARQEALLRRLGLGGSWRDLPPPARAHHEWMGLLDGLSLFVLDEWDGPLALDAAGATYEATREGPPGAPVVVVDPFPFRREAEFAVPARLLPRGRYDDEEKLRADLAAAETVTVDVRLRAP